MWKGTSSDAVCHEGSSSNAQRYQIQSKLGSGGMAVVYCAVDTRDGRRVALKCLESSSESETQARNLALFELEFHTLAQLAHPHVVQVYDFGLDGAGAYYTMELLDGGDLHGLAPLPWRRVCAIARDICSALCLLHSRRLVHRDISPRNVRCDASLRAKLIDFGAVGPAGPSKLLIGTPPCCPPESLHGQTLDGRTDLYGLGATMYFMLVGCHAYAAHHFRQLHDAWQAGIVRPRQHDPELPEALEALVLDLLQADPDARPSSAAEVLQRLAAIDGCSASEQSLTAQAYLATPALVGCQLLLERVARRLKRAASGERRNVLIEGSAGVGRSRFLDACLLDASLRGMQVLRLDADDALGGEYGVVLAIARLLLKILPQAALEAARPFEAVLCSLTPELFPHRRSFTTLVGLDAVVRRDEIQLAFCQWLEALSRRHTLVIAVDDVHAIDEPSAALLASLALREGPAAVAIVVTAAQEAAWTAQAAHKLLLGASTRIELRCLSPEQSQQFYRSLFGDVPNCDLLAHHAHALCAGNPRDLLRCAQHWLERGIVRYQGGSWTLRATFDPGDLPTSLAQTLQARVASLSETALELACGLALCSEQRFSLEECLRLSGARDSAQLLAGLDQLSQADITRRIDDRIQLTRLTWVAPLTAAIEPARKAVLHAKLAELFRSRGDDGLRTGQQLLLAGETSHGLDLILAFAREVAREERRLIDSSDTVRTPVPGYTETLNAARRACLTLGRPRGDSFLLLQAQTGMNALFGVHDKQPLTLLLEQLAHDSGLNDWLALSGQTDPQQRLTAALQCAQSRYEETAPQDRSLAPVAAIRSLATVVFSALSTTGPAFDLAYLRSFPDLAPFVPLSPALRLVTGVVNGMLVRMSGRIEPALAAYAEALALISAPGSSGLSPVVAEYARLALLNRIGVMEAGTGRAGCLERVAQLELAPNYSVNALLIRRLHALFQGDLIEADRCARAVDRLRIELGGRQVSAGTHLSWEIDAHVLSEDLTRLRRAMEELAPLAEQHSGWKPAMLYALAAQHRICRAYSQALTQIESALELAPIGEHQLWQNIAHVHVLALLDTHQHERARTCADAYLASARSQLGIAPEELQLACAWAHAACGLDDAAALADDARARLIAGGVTGLRVGYAHEIQARIALLAGDSDAYTGLLASCTKLYRAYKSPALTAKLQRLIQSGERSDAGDSRASTPSLIEAVGRCGNAELRAQLTLQLLARITGAHGGFLFGAIGAELSCQATLGDLELDASLLGRVDAYLQLFMRSDVTTVTGAITVREAATVSSWTDVHGESYQPVLLRHFSEGRIVLTGLALLTVVDGVTFKPPLQLASELSRQLTRIGDSSIASRSLD